MIDIDAIEQRLSQLIQMEDECFVAGFHQNTEKQRPKAWHDHHIRTKHFEFGGLFLLYDKKFLKYPWKLKTHWIGPYMIAYIIEVGAVKLHKLDGTPFIGMINGSHLKPYYDGHEMPMEGRKI